MVPSKKEIIKKILQFLVNESKNWINKEFNKFKLNQ